MMRSWCLLLVFLPVWAIAQTPLAYSRHSSVFTYVYKITPDEARTYFTRKFEPEKKLLHSLVDSFSQERPSLPAGNYLLVRAVENRMEYELLQEGDVAFTVLQNDRDLSILIHKAGGGPLRPQEVRLNRRRLHYLPETGIYRLARQRKGGRLEFLADGVLYQYRLQRNRRWEGNALWWVKTHFPVKQIRKLVGARDYRYRDFARGTRYEQGFRGYLAFSKPEYRPGDTVRGKAFVTRKGGRPLRQPMLLRLSDRYLDTDTILTVVRPYRRGGYRFEFILHDSLNLDLDEDYTITLEEKRSRKYDLETYEGGLDDEAYAAKRKVVMRGTFRHEDYELKKIQLTATADRKEHGRGTPLNLTLKATDENELPVADARVRIRVTPSAWPGTEFRAPRVFLPDTLWMREQALDPQGELKLALPDSIFPAAAFAYTIECELLTSDNEMRGERLSVRFRGEDVPLLFTWKGDSILLDTELEAQRPAKPVHLFALNRNGDTMEKRTVMLPAALPFNGFVSVYTAVVDSSQAAFRPADAEVLVHSRRTADSVWMELVNPHGMPVWYTIYAGNRPVRRGWGPAFRFAEKARTDLPYFVSIQYVLAGSSQNRLFNIPFFAKQLQLSVEQPRFIYPGQTTEIDITVRDHRGRPVPAADLTAFAFTRNFSNPPAVRVPYFGKSFRGLKRRPALSPASLDAVRFTGLNWQHWAGEMGLDSIEYFRFLHPRQLYRKVEPAPDSITQVAPFVVENGAIVPIQHLMIDGVPRFFSQTHDLKRYSFDVPWGYRNFEIRTATKRIVFNKVWVEKGMKTFLSVDAAGSNDSVRVEKQPAAMTAAEQSLWRRYLILIENNFEEGTTYVRQNGRLTLLRPSEFYYNRGHLLAGPFAARGAELVSTNGFREDFEVEGAYRYRIDKGYVRQKEVGKDELFTPYLPGQGHRPSFADYVLTEEEIDSLWQDYLDHRSLNEDLFTNPDLRGKNTGVLQFELKEDSLKGSLKNIFLLKADDPDFLRVYRGDARNLGAQMPGRYRIYFLFTKGRYALGDSITVRPNGTNFYRIGLKTRPGKDSLSIRISELIDKRLKRDRNDNSILDGMKPGLNTMFYSESDYTTEVSGVIRDNKGEPVSFASVRIRGTNRATLTDARGAYRILAPANAQLEISAVGFSQHVLAVNSDRAANVTLWPAQQDLQEVVVVGYSATKRRSMTASTSKINPLQGRVPGITVTESFGATARIQIRGASSVGDDARLLVIIDGRVMPRSALETLDPDDVAEVQVLDGAKAAGIYGSAGAGGAVLITTKRAVMSSPATAEPGELPAGSIRRRFRDDAYWQPMLRTDRAGKARFTVTFPDDLTNWRSLVLAMGPKKTSGQWEGSIRAFRPLVASLSVPLFLIEGDTLSVIGKTTNHIGDSLQLRRVFSVNGEEHLNTRIALRQGWIDSLGVRATGDSMRLQYAVQKESGYADGEFRAVPVYRRGVLETSGFFLALPNDTAMSIQLPKSEGWVRLHAEASALPVLEDEISRVRNYSYDCNEQMASKLKALMLQKKVDAFYKRRFTGEREVLRLIGQLQRNRNSDGLWGWWPKAPSQLWITQHAAEALLAAKGQGYAIQLDIAALKNELIYQLERGQGTEKITALRLLQRIDTTADIKRYADSIERRSPAMSLYDRLRLLEIRQANRERVSLDTLQRYRRETLFGNSYWGADSVRLFDNPVQNTLIAYRILRAAQADEGALARVRNYLLEKRTPEGWRNTYESALILETILPDLLGRDGEVRPARLELRGGSTLVIDRFPFDQTVKNGEFVSLRKTGDLPVYFTAYEQHWNRDPERVDADFRVRTSFVQDGETATRLTGGKAATLRVNVDVARDAEYVMINVPIPAGCSYEQKTQSRQYNEVHREHFRDRATIFCGRLNRGSYEFSIRLMPRYSGRYTLNPARAEQMYFPVFFGREQSKSVEIR